MGKQSDHPRAYTKKAVQKGWLMYDWANSAYFLVITTAIFPLFYTAITTTTVDGVISDAVSFMGKTFINTQLYSYIIAASFLIVIIASPLLSGMADYLAEKSTHTVSVFHARSLVFSTHARNAGDPGNISPGPKANLQNPSSVHKIAHVVTCLYMCPYISGCL